MEAVKKEILLTEQQCADIAQVLLARETKCRRNAENCRNGYGTARSAVKEDRWIEQADYMNSLAETLNERWL